MYCAEQVEWKQSSSKFWSKSERGCEVWLDLGTKITCIIKAKKLDLFWSFGLCLVTISIFRTCYILSYYANESTKVMKFSIISRTFVNFVFCSNPVCNKRKTLTKLSLISHRFGLFDYIEFDIGKLSD